MIPPDLQGGGSDMRKWFCEWFDTFRELGFHRKQIKSMIASGELVAGKVKIRKRNHLDITFVPKRTCEHLEINFNIMPEGGTENA